MESLNYVQRAALLAAQERRMKAAKLARLQQAIAAAQAPDYFTYQWEQNAFSYRKLFRAPQVRS